MAKKEKTTLQTRNKYRLWKVGLYGGTILAPTIPASIHTGVMWGEWTKVTGGISLPFGFVCLLITVGASIIAILNSDTILKKKDIALLSIGLIFIMVGLTNMFLAKLFEMLGWLWIEAGGGLLASFTSYKVEQKKIEPQLVYYNGLVEEYGLDKKSAKKIKAKQQAEEEARAKAEKEKESVKW